MNYQRGWTAIGALAVIVAAGTGAFAFDCILALNPAGTKYSPPWLLISVFLFPVVFYIQLVVKLRSVENVSGLSRMERRRLIRIVGDKRRQVWIGVAFHVFSAVFTAIVFMLPTTQPLFYAGYDVVGGLLGIGILIMTFVWREFEATNSFVRDQQLKADDDKAVKEALKEFDES